MTDLAARLEALSPRQRALFELRLESRRAAEGVQTRRQEAPQRGPGESAAVAGGMQFSLFFFSDQGSPSQEGMYHLLLESARFADRNGFCAVWTPERHFHEFGGPYPNPSVLGAALAVATHRLQVRAGSVVVPLHHPIRIAEEWSVLDNLSGGRVGVAFASGWHPDDFVLARQLYAKRREATFQAVDLVRRLWAGEPVPFPGDRGETRVRIFPRPVQARLPLWITSSGNPDTWSKAGELGANVLTGMMEQTLDELARNIRAYRGALAQHGHDPRAGQVTLMLHTYLGDDLDDVRARVKGPMLAYLRTHLGLYERLARSQDIQVDVDRLTERDREALLAFGFERYFSTSALLGTPSSCLRRVERLQAVGVNEIACLINFGLDFEQVMASLEKLRGLQDRCARGGSNEEGPGA